MTRRGPFHDDSPMSPRRATLVAVCLLVHCGPAREEPVSRPEAGDRRSDLAGTSWRLVRFEGGDGTTLTPDDPVADGGIYEFEPIDRVGGQ